VFEGEIRAGMKIELHSTGKRFEVQEVGVLRLDLSPAEGRSSGTRWLRSSWPGSA
jgi:translation elongation factor EF-4